jgi:hypothetical protein
MKTKAKRFSMILGVLGASLLVTGPCWALTRGQAVAQVRKQSGMPADSAVIEKFLTTATKSKRALATLHTPDKCGFDGCQRFLFVVDDVGTKNPKYKPAGEFQGRYEVLTMDPATAMPFLRWIRGTGENKKERTLKFDGSVYKAVTETPTSTSKADPKANTDPNPNPSQGSR